MTLEQLLDLIGDVVLKAWWVADQAEQENDNAHVTVDLDVMMRLDEALDKIEELDYREPGVELGVSVKAQKAIQIVFQEAMAKNSALLQVQLNSLTHDLNEADRRAGAAERRYANEKEARDKNSHWIRRAKEERGYHDNVSFDDVWKQTCEKADRADAMAQQLEILAKRLRFIADKQDLSKKEFLQYQEWADEAEKAAKGMK